MSQREMRHSESRPDGPCLGLICQHFYPEMVSTGLLMTELATGLRAKDWRVAAYAARPTSSLVDAEDPRVRRQSTYEGVEVNRVTAFGGHRKGIVSRLLFGVTYLVAVLFAVFQDRDRLDALVVTTNPPFIGLVGCLAARVLDIPYAVLVHDVYPDLAVQMGILDADSVQARLWSGITNMTLRRASGIIVLGDDMKTIIERKMDSSEAPIEVIQNWSDDRSMHPVPDEENSFLHEHDLTSRFTVVYSGNMGRTHNLEPLLEAASELREDPRFRFLLIGDGAKKERLKQMAMRRQLENVSFLPYQPKERLPEVLSAADLSVVCLDSRYTGLSVPSKTYGILATGTAVLGLLDEESEIGQTILRHGCGVVVEDATGADVAAVLRRLVNNPDQVREQSEAARSTFVQRFTRRNAVDQYDQFLRGVFGACNVRHSDVER